MLGCNQSFAHLWRSTRNRLYPRELGSKQVMHAGGTTHPYSGNQFRGDIDEEEVTRSSLEVFWVPVIFVNIVMMLF